MGGNIKPYTMAVDAEKLKLSKQLASGRVPARDIAIVRRAAENMEKELSRDPARVLKVRDPEKWRNTHEQIAVFELFPHEATDENSKRYTDRYKEYLDLALKIIQSPDMSYKYAEDRYRRRVYLYRPNPLIPTIMKLVGDELMRWFKERHVTYELLLRPATLGFETLFLKERPDIRVLLRIAETLPLDVEISEMKVERPLAVEALELAIGLIPVVGSIVASYEAYSGVDIFGYPLSDLERSILGASVLLPAAGRLVKGGRALYSEARLVKLYGHDAAAWSKTVRAGGKASSSSLHVIAEAESSIRAQRALSGTLARNAASELPKVVRGSTSVSTSVDQAISDLFRELTSKNSAIKSLDEFALQRVLEKGPNVDHLKGQLLEEIVEARIVPWLRDRSGSFALGIETGGKKLEFIPGHLIRDASGRQISDGMLVMRNNGVLEIAAVFEAKAGKRAARELSLASGSISSLSAADRAELRAYAKDVLREQSEIAHEAGKPFKKSIEDVEKEIALSEKGGQVRRDIERLSENVDGSPVRIRVGSEFVPIRMSPKRTKFFGILPRDVNRSLIERELRDGGFNYEIIGADISQSDLKSLAGDMVNLAKTMAEAI